ncbi:molybdenum cofactor biosynthesis protein MoaE [Solimonas marina]|uniref:Molybdopterin synthase catalytic subunit n=1 Tax=Solimonas marina TaxID=2714601 RepID=A0A970B732_9GAMM|nr:molybdenum cofactor biosynthesis protein MoaE [Solimonas marina]NKF23453.1 molybdenum cofactor biosynthesis protein MoaE [Solimonas marina]
MTTTRDPDHPRIQDRTLSLESLLADGAFPECGGLSLFAGTVRDHHDGKAVLRLAYTAYAPLAEKQIREIEAAVAAKHGTPYLRVVHRVGALAVGETAILCVARAPHRAEAFAACKEAVDRVKHEVPIWKEEFYADGTSAFVEGCCIAPDADESQAASHRHDADHHHHAHG